MFTFSIVKKIGKGDYLNEGCFILERIRRENALNMYNLKNGKNKHKAKPFTKDGKPKPS